MGPSSLAEVARDANLPARSDHRRLLRSWVMLCEWDSRPRRLAFMADGAVLGFVVIEGHDEHVIAADANAVDLRLGLAVGFRIGGCR